MPDAVMDKERVNLGDGRASYSQHTQAWNAIHRGLHKTRTLVMIGWFSKLQSSAPPNLLIHSVNKYQATLQSYHSIMLGYFA